MSGRKTKDTEPHHNPRDRGWEADEGMGQRADIEPGKPVGCADGKDDSHEDAEVDRLSGHEGRGPDEVGLVGKIAGSNPKGDAVRKRVELFSNHTLSLTDNLTAGRGALLLIFRGMNKISELHIEIVSQKQQ